MVKELTMDNTILGLGAISESKVSESTFNSSVNEFEKVFETTTQYADKKDLKTDSQKVVKVAEKTVSSERTRRTNKDTSASVTKVNKTKVSSKTSSKSPNSAVDTTNAENSTKTADAKSGQKEVDTTSDAYSFSVKESLSPESVVAEEAQNEGFSVENSNIEDIVLNSAQVMAAEIVQNIADKAGMVSVLTKDETTEEESKAPSVELLEVLSDTEAEEVLDLEVGKVSSDLELETLEATTAENIIVEEEFDGMTGAASQIVEEDVEIAVKGSSNTQTGKFELKEGWEAVSADEQLLTQDELSQLVDNTEKEQVAVETDVMEGDSAIRVVEKDVDVEADKQLVQDKVNAVPKNMRELDIKDVKPHTLEEIAAGKDKEKLAPTKNETQIVETDVQAEVKEAKVEAKVEVETDTVEDMTNKKDSLVKDSNVEAELNVELDELIAEVKTSVSTDDSTLKPEKEIVKPESIKVETDVEIEAKEEKVVIEDEPKGAEIEAALDSEEDIKVKTFVAKDNLSEDAADSVDKQQILDADEAIVENNRVQIKEELKQQESEMTVDTKEVEASVAVKTVKTKDEDVEVKTSVRFEDDIQDVETEIEEVVIEEDNFQDMESQENSSSLQQQVSEQKEYGFGEDVDSYLNSCIKLAFVDTNVKQAEETDVISALENKFADDAQLEAGMDNEVVVDDVEIEQFASLDELVDLEEVEDLKLQLRDSVMVSDAPEGTVSSSTNSTTEQMIRYAIEGESGFEPTMPVSTAFKPQAAMTQSAPSSARDVLAQLSEKLSTFNLNAGSKLTMQLSPENLGKIEISLTNTAKGVIAEMTVSSDETCEMMKKNIEELKETLQKYGVRFDNVNVRTAAAQQSAANQDYTEQGNAQKHHHEQKREEKEQQGKQSFDEAFSSFSENKDEE